jgi:hypothetical protein
MSCAKCGRKFRGPDEYVISSVTGEEEPHPVCIFVCLKTDAEKLREWVDAAKESVE